jgi:BASS family bile acid:Na+ symporter
MNMFMQFLQNSLGPLVLVFTVSNLFAMGLQVKMPQLVTALKNRRAIVLIFLWGWVLGPAFGYLITRVIPLEDPYKIVILLACLAPCAPILQQMVGKARGDVGFAGAFIPIVTLGTVVFMPLLAPLLIKGLTVSPAALAKPLLLTILLPLLIGAAIRHYADTAATRIFPAVKGLAMISTLLTVALCLTLYGRGILDTAGEFALASMTLFMVGMAVITYRFSFGLTQSQRSVMSMGMGAQNGAAIFACVFAMKSPDQHTVVMVIMWVLWSTILAPIFARIFARLAVKAEAEGKA